MLDDTFCRVKYNDMPDIILYVVKTTIRNHALKTNQSIKEHI